MKHNLVRLVLVYCSVGFAAGTIWGDVLRVGPGRQYELPSQAAAAAQNGDVIEIDPVLYEGDVCRWFADDLTIRGVNGKARLDADGNSAEGKAIWVIKGDNCVVENIEFFGCAVPDRNGAGIRQEGTDLVVRHCWFHDNQNGFLCGANAQSDIVFEFCQFNHNGFGDGFSHNLYIGHVKSFTMQHCYSHHAKIGHNVKSRAYENYILYNRVMDEADGTSSYAIDLSNGGRSYVVGNLVQQGPNTDNSTIISYAAEGASNPEQDLYIVNNTIVNDRHTGIFVRVSNSSDPATITNNILLGPGTAFVGPRVVATNLIETNNAGLVDRAGFDYRLMETSPAVDAGSDPGQANGFALRPTFHYDHPAGRQGRCRVNAVDIGAYEFGCADLNDFQIVTGTLLSGTIDGLSVSDDEFVTTRSGFGETFLDLHHMEMIVSATTSVGSPSSIDLTIESRVDYPTGIAQVHMRNWATNDLELVGQYAIGETEEVQQLTGINAADYVEPGSGNIDVAIRHVVFVPFFAFTFESSVDHLEIRIR